MKSEELWMELHVLYQRGWNVSALARHFKLNRRSVSRQLEAERPQGYPERAPLHPLTWAVHLRGTGVLRVLARRQAQISA